VKEAEVDGLAKDMALYGLHDVCASLEWISAGLDVDLRV
jgi:hypothetical protein